jgi:hypothetical protein
MPNEIANFQELFEEVALENDRLRTILAWAGRNLPADKKPILAKKLSEQIPRSCDEDDEADCEAFAVKLEKLCDAAQDIIDLPEDQIPDWKLIARLDEAVNTMRHFTIADNLKPTLRALRGKVNAQD